MYLYVQAAVFNHLNQGNVLDHFSKWVFQDWDWACFVVFKMKKVALLRLMFCDFDLDSPQYDI